MKEKKKLFEDAMALLENVNLHLKDMPQLPIINSLMASVIKNISEILIKELIGTYAKEQE